MILFSFLHVAFVFSGEMKMSGPNGDPEVTADEGIIEDDFNEEGEFYGDGCKQQSCRFEINQ